VGESESDKVLPVSRHDKSAEGAGGSERPGEGRPEVTKGRIRARGGLGVGGYQLPMITRQGTPRLKKWTNNGVKWWRSNKGKKGAVRERTLRSKKGGEGKGRIRFESKKIGAKGPIKVCGNPHHGVNWDRGNRSGAQVKL